MLARKNTQTLHDFVRDCKGNVAAAEALASTIADGPLPGVFHFPPASQFVLPEHKERKKAEASSSAVLTVYLELTLTKMVSYAKVIPQLSQQEAFELACDLRSLFGVSLFEKDKDETAQQRLYLFSHAAFYQVTRHGACSYRASFAALKLVEILKNCGVSVALQSSPDRDHFIVLLYSKEIGCYAYDPLTNPRMLYDRDFYLNNILSTFPRLAKPKKAFNFVITANLLDFYEKQFPAIEKYFLEQIAKGEKDPAVLMKDELLMGSLVVSKIQPKDVKKELLQAIKKAGQIASAIKESQSFTGPH